MIQMTSRYRTGDLIGADEAFEGGQRYFTTPEFCRRPGMPAQTFGNAALNACIMGEPAEARRRVDQALAVSRDSDSPYDMAFAQYMASMHAILASEPAEAEDLARRSNHLSVERGFPQFMATTRIVLGRARAELGEPAEGLTLIRDGLTAMAETGFRVGATMYLSWLAEAQALGGALDDALGTLDEALSTNPQELFFRPESLRLRADFRARKGDVGGALIDYRDAIGLSKTMGAKLFHSRASTGLAALGELQTA
jgi:tetratricopeptide (TPR) repeat protein